MCVASWGCAHLPPPDGESPGSFARLSPRELPYLEDDGDPNQLKTAISRQIEHFRGLSFRDAAYWVGDRQVSQEHLNATLEMFLDVLDSVEKGEDLNELLETHFDIYEAGGSPKGPSIIFTGYYEPELAGSYLPDETFAYPIYRRPDDLVVLEKNVADNNAKSRKMAARLTEQGPVPYYTRREIDEGGALTGRDLEIVYLKNPLDRYVLHVQGSGRIRLTEGQILGVHFAGSNYYAYRSLRMEMIGDGVLSPEDASMESIRSYFSRYPDRLDDFLNRNERYTFFKVRKGGVTGSLGVELTSGRSIATDKHVFPAGGLL
jgi:membrane-bound lytic murein transglycosylase A